MDKLKQWVALTALAGLAIVAAGWMLLISPKKSEASDLQAQKDEQVSTNSALQNQVRVLKAKAKELPREKAKLAAVAAKIPPTTATPALIRALTDAADASGVEFISLAPSAPTAVTAASALAAPVASSGTSSTTTTATAAASASDATAGLFAMPVTINVAGGYFEVQQFLDQLENLPRAFKVVNLAVSPGADPTRKSASGTGATTDGSQLVSAITGTVYLNPTTAPATSTSTVSGASTAATASTATSGTTTTAVDAPSSTTPTSPAPVATK